MTAKTDAMELALRDLLAMVRGECPSLLDEDSDGDGMLALRIESALALPPDPDYRAMVDKLECRIAAADADIARLTELVDAYKGLVIIAERWVSYTYLPEYECALEDVRALEERP